MKIFVRAKAGAKENKVMPPEKKLFQTTSDSDVYTVLVKEPPRDGKANDAIIRELADYFGVPRASVRLVSGARAKRKLFDINV